MAKSSIGWNKSRMSSITSKGGKDRLENPKVESLAHVIVAQGRKIRTPEEATRLRNRRGRDERLGLRGKVPLCGDGRSQTT
jgi:hypothetical protein